MDEAAQEMIVQAEGLTLAEVLPVWDTTGSRFVAQLRGADPSLRDAPVPGLKWTVAETAAHMLSILRRGLNDFRRSGTRAGLAVLNDLCISEIEERNLAALADLIESARAKTARVLHAMSEEDAAASTFPLHVGLQANVPTALSYGMFDFIGHGYDISLATGEPLDMDPVEVGTTLRAILPALRPWITEEVLNGPRRDVSLRFVPDVSLHLQTGEGIWTVRAIDAAAAEIEVDPTELFLAIAGRANSEDPIVTSVAGWFSPI